MICSNFANERERTLNKGITCIMYMYKIDILLLSGFCVQLISFMCNLLCLHIMAIHYIIFIAKQQM